jgi:YggT family protein
VPHVAALIFVLQAARWLVILDAVLTWVMPPDGFPRSLTKTLLDPVYAPLRRVLMPLTGNVDLSPLIVLAALFFLQRALTPKRPAQD